MTLWILSKNSNGSREVMEEIFKPKSDGRIGFKDLSLFNDALLVKQAWRLFYNQNSLFYRIFKVRFFPNCSIIEASNSLSGLYPWKSILKGKDVPNKGTWWRLRNGGPSISIWGDFWLPLKDCPMIMSLVMDDLLEARVDSLIYYHQKLG